MTHSVVIVAGARTPMGGLQGVLSDVSAVDLGTTAIKAVLDRSGVNPEAIDEVIMGNVLSAGLKQGPARQAALNAGIPASAGATTLNKLCGSGMQATIFAHDQIKAGSSNCAIVGGMESMTNAPHILLKARSGVRTGHAQMYDHMFLDGLEDAYTGRMMGSFAQETADKNNLTREAMDAFAIESLTRAQNAINNKSLSAETAPVTIKNRKGEVTITDDEQPLKGNIEKIPTLRPAFAKDGTITAANASSISDGASALLLMSEETAKKQNLTPLARIIAHSRFSQSPEDFTLSPIGSIKSVLQKAGWAKEDVELYEINEAFAMVTMLAIQSLDLDPATVNIHGGACAQGHPIGSTGSRVIVSLMHALKQYGKKRGVASLCIGGGEATAIAIELI